MSLEAPGAARHAQGWSWRSIPWPVGLVITVIVGMAIHDIWRSYQAAVAQTGRELETQARVIAEQTTRSLQTVDRVSRHVAEAYRSGKLARLSPSELQAYLSDQAVGLVQIEGLSLIDADGRVRASSSASMIPDGPSSLAELPSFGRLRGDRGSALWIEDVHHSAYRPGQWFFPMLRRVERADGSFAGAVVANGSVDYFARFYRDARLDEGTAITLLHRDGTLVARHPAADAALGQPFPRLGNMVAARASGQEGPARSTSPIDGIDRIGSVALVPEYPLAVVVTRQAAAALAPWREQAVGTAVRTLALGILATALLVLIRRQFSRLDKVRESLEHSRERFALAAAGSDEGIWDWDLAGDRMYSSARAQEIFGLSPGPDIQPRREWLAQVVLHPDDIEPRRLAMRAHLSGQTPVYAGEHRVRAGDGGYRWIRVRGLCVRDAKGRALRMAGSVTDIDAHKRAEDALRISEERYALAMTGSTGGYWVWETATDALFVSSAMNQLYGQPADLQTSTRREYFSHVRVHPQDQPQMQQMARDVMDGGVARLDVEYRILLPGTDEPRWILTRAQCFRDAAGAPLRVAGVSVDISERKRTEQALRLSEERFALAVAGSMDGIVDWDVVNDRMYSSERMLEMIGEKPDVTLRSRAEWTALMLLHPDDVQRHGNELQRFLASNETVRQGEYRIRRADGEFRWVRIRNLCLRDAQGRPLRLAGSVSDIDAYKRVEAALRESEARYALAMTGSNEGHWVWEIASDTIYVSPKLRELFALPGDASSMPYSEYFAQIPIHPEDREPLRRARDDHVAGRTPKIDNEFRIVLGDGEQRWIHTRGQCFRDADGRPLRVAGSTMDVTQRKQSEQALRDSEQRFALAVAGSDDGVWDFDFINQRMFTSRRGRQILGIPLEPESQDMDVWRAAMQLHPDDVALRQAALDAHLSGQAPAYECEYRVRHGDGEYRWVRVHAVCVRDAAGQPLRMAGSVSDIDARRRAEESLRQSQERYALAVAGSDDGVWDWDFAAGLAFESARARELQGLPPGPELQPLPELADSLRVHPDDAATRAEGIRAHLAGETPAYECEYRVRHADGQYRWIRVRALCIRDAGGTPVRMAGSVSDIDSRKRAEVARRDSEERFTLAVAGANDGILDWDIANDRMYVSERALRITGIDPSVVVRNRGEWSALMLPRLHPDDSNRLKAELRLHPDGHPPSHDGEYRVRHADGPYRWVRFRGMSVRDADGRPIRWAGSLSDIDAEKRTEEALRRSEERFQLAVLGSNEGLWDWDLASDSLFLSPRAQELLWLEPGEPQRPRREWIALTDYHPDDRGPVRAALKAHLRGETPQFKVEYQLRHHGGEWRWYRQRGIAVRDAAGHPTRMAGSMEDISERKRAEAERERLEAQLRQAQKLEAIGTLAGGIAHDFNNILAAILGYGEMAQRDAAEGSAQRRHIDAAMSAGMRAKSLVERILAFSRSGMGERVPVHVQSVVVEALDAVAASLPARIRLERQLSAGDAAVLGDATQVHQVVMNLCANAVQAMKSSGTLSVTLDTVELLAPHCVTSVLADGSYVRLTVRDTGMGIAPQLLERIFDPFFTTKEIGVGTGLGLSLVHGIVTDLGGGIDVASSPGEGATFSVYMPWQSCVAEAPSVEEAVAPGAGETVLLVDDEESLVRLGEEMIAALGYEPVGFTSSSEALDRFRAAPQRFDAVLSDEAMPEMTGSELARQIRAIRGDIPIVLMSGYVTAALTQRARELGVADVLAKPLVAREIARSLASALRG